MMKRGDFLNSYQLDLRGQGKTIRLYFLSSRDSLQRKIRNNISGSCDSKLTIKPFGKTAFAYSFLLSLLFLLLMLLPRLLEKQSSHFKEQIFAIQLTTAECQRGIYFELLNRSNAPTRLLLNDKQQRIIAANKLFFVEPQIVRFLNRHCQIGKNKLVFINRGKNELRNFKVLKKIKSAPNKKNLLLSAQRVLAAAIQQPTNNYAKLIDKLSLLPFCQTAANEECLLPAEQKILLALKNSLNRAYLNLKFRYQRAIALSNEPQQKIIIEQLEELNDDTNDPRLRLMIDSG